MRSAANERKEPIMPLADQLRTIERDRDAVLDQMDGIISAAEHESRGFTEAEAEAIARLKAEASSLSARHKTVKDALDAQKFRAAKAVLDGAGGISSGGADFDLREALIRSGLYEAIHRSGNLTGRSTIRINAKTLLTGSAAPGLAPRNSDLGAVQAQFGSAPLLGSLAFIVPVSGGIVIYSRVTIGAGGAAKQAPEGTAKARITLVGDPKSAPVATYAAWEKISTQALGDVDQVVAVVESMLRGAVLDNISADIYAVATAAGNSTPFVPVAGDVAQDSIIKAAAAIAATGAARVTVGVNPVDFASMATAKAQGGGSYLGVSPMMAMPAIVQSAAIPPGKLLASASDGTGLCFALRWDLDFQIGLDADDFTKNLRTALAEARGLPFVRAPIRVMTGDLTTVAGAARR